MVWCGVLRRANKDKDKDNFIQVTTLERVNQKCHKKNAVKVTVKATLICFCTKLERITKVFNSITCNIQQVYTNDLKRFMLSIDFISRGSILYNLHPI